MRKNKLSLGTIFLMVTFLVISCQKRIYKPAQQEELNRPSNRPPVANAGTDKTITLPTNSINLDGSASNDPDNDISSYAWIKISGPPSFSIVNTNSVQTQVTNLIEGVYQFELKVTDAGGLFSRDTMLVEVNATPECDNSNRPTINAQLVPIATLSGVPWAVTSAGNKLVFAIPGAVNNVNDLTLDIYDLTVHTWSTKFWHFSQPLANYDVFPTVVGVGDKVLFAGGEVDILTLDVVQIYDVSDDIWTVAHLSESGSWFSAATCGDKAFFTGPLGQQAYGNTSVDIYNATTGSWSTASLSVPRSGVTSVSGNNKVYFTGGIALLPGLPISNIIDIYDNATNTWSTSTMQFSRFFHAGVSVNDILYFAGGSNIVPYSQNNPAICSVETLNTITGDRAVMDLFRPASWQTYGGQNAVLKQNKIVFLRHNEGAYANKFDIYDTQTNTWSIGMVPQALPVGAMAISVNNTIYITGGDQNTQVWKLEF